MDSEMSRSSGSERDVLQIEDVTIGIALQGLLQPIVVGVSLTIPRGGALGLVGKSGSGKSLTALSVGGILPSPLSVLSGRILLDGVDVCGLSEAKRHATRGREVAYVFQDPLSALNPTITVGRHLFDVIRQHNGATGAVARAKAIEALRSVGIAEPEGRINAYPHQLSGGMRQRVLIAMSLLCRPKLLIADEPTTALDVTVQARIVNLFRGIRRKGISILFVSHNLDLILEFCDSVVVMYGGRIMEKAPPADIVRSPRHPYTRALLDCVPRLNSQPGMLRVIAGQPPRNLGAICGCPFAERCDRVQPACRSEPPPLNPSSDTQAFACWNPLPLSATLS